jgi:preprotein translocase subunit SecA
VKRAYEAKAANEHPETLKTIERLIVLNALDRLWQEHLYNMDQLRNGIGLRAYGQKDPLVEYKMESYELFTAMMDRIEEEALRYLYLLQPVSEEDLPKRKQQSLYYQEPSSAGSPPQRAKQARSMIPSKKKRHH